MPRGSRPIFLRIACTTLVVSALGVVFASDKEQTPSTYRRPNFRLYAAGREVFETRCIICHGPNGDGKGEMSASLPIKPRSFVQGIFKYRTTPPGKLPTDED